MLTLTEACVMVVLVAAVARATAGWPDHLGVRVGAMTASAIVPLGLLVWLPSGPLAAGWARRAGTPSALLPASSSTTAAAPGPAARQIGPRLPAGSSTSFDAQVSGTIRQGESDDGGAIVDLSLDVTGQRLSRLRIRIAGQPLAGGGVEMTSSRVTLGPASNPDQYRGKLTALQGSDLEARVRDAGGVAITLVAHLQIDPGSARRGNGERQAWRWSVMAVETDRALPRLLAGVGDRPITPLESHLDLHWPLADLRRWAPAQIIDLIEQAALRGHCGASFPVARKLRTVAARRKPKILVVNGLEGEPASKKDRVLLRELPHLVLDGAAIAARAVGAGRAIIAISDHNERAAQSVGLALRERRDGGLRGEPRFELVGVPERFVSGQESAVVNALSGGPAKPTFGPRPFERGVRNRPTLVHNAETVAHMALIARHGAAWFRQLGTERDPGSTLISLSGAVASPGVYEIENGMALVELLQTAGATDELAAVLIGGYFGSWLPATHIPRLRLAPASLAEHGASLGAGVIVALDRTACPVAETARIADYFAAQSAGQCGPCVNGLGAIADTVQRLASGTAPGGAQRQLERWTSELPRRGACQYPDGAARFVASALRVFADAFREHAQRGPCERCSQPGVLRAPC